MSFARRLRRVLVALAAAAAALAPFVARAEALRYCDRPRELGAAEQSRLLRFAAVVRDVLERSGSVAAIVSRSGLDLGRFGIRYSHAGLSLRANRHLPWSVRQLYYACEEARPRLFDQGLAAFVLGTDDPRLGYVSVLLLPSPEGDVLERAALDDAQALRLLGARYSANAYPFAEAFQNCNQWLAEMLALAWAGPGAIDGGSRPARGEAQRWLHASGYRPAEVEVGAPLMWAGLVVPYVHNRDHPAEDLARGAYRISLPASIEAFVRARLPDAQRVEICHDGRQAVVHRGWTPLAPGCVAQPGDSTVRLDD